MKQTIKKYAFNLAAATLFGGMFLAMPADLQAKTRAESAVHITVNVHGSDINVSSDVLESAVDKLLKAAEIDVVETGADANVVELEINIYKDDDGKGFKVDSNWDDDEAEIEKHIESQDEIDEIVEEEVEAFIKFMHKG